MSKIRKPNNARARVERASRALLSTNHVGVINIDPHGGQFLVHLKTGKPIRHGVALANAVCDIAHRWVIYFSAFCIDQNGLHYIKSCEIATPGQAPGIQRIRSAHCSRTHRKVRELWKSSMI